MTGRFSLLLGLLLVVSGWLSAQTDSSAQGPTARSRQFIGIGWGIDPIEPTRRQLDVLLGDVQLGHRYKLATSLRYGRYAPAKLVGSERAELDGFAAGARKGFWSLYMGLQGAAPVLPTAWDMYARVALGLSDYMGQQFREAPPGEHPSNVQRKIGSRLAPGVEGALGKSWLRVSGEFGLRAEVRLGYERIPRSNRQGLNSMVIFGCAFPL